jgi:hypothetical protein
MRDNYEQADKHRRTERTDRILTTVNKTEAKNERNRMTLSNLN